MAKKIMKAAAKKMASAAGKVARKVKRDTKGVGQAKEARFLRAKATVQSVTGNKAGAKRSRARAKVLEVASKVNTGVNMTATSDKKMKAQAKARSKK